MTTDADTKTLLIGILTELERQADATGRIAKAIGTTLADLSDDGASETAEPEPEDDGDAFVIGLIDALDQLAAPPASYWIDGDGRIRDVEIHGGPVDFALAARIAAHNAERTRRP